jgi:antibiotic biosynthesis monooxygenase (ABM) superfamily enzyme
MVESALPAALTAPDAPVPIPVPAGVVRPVDLATVDEYISKRIEQYATWYDAKCGPALPASPLTGLPLAARAYTLTSALNHTPYTVTLNAVVSGAAVLTSTVLVTPTQTYFLDLPLVRH